MLKAKQPIVRRPLSWNPAVAAYARKICHAKVRSAVVAVERARSQELTAYELTVDNLRKDAERYRKLRLQHWNDSELAAVRFPKDALKLGSDSPSGDRLDALVDALP